MTLQKQYQQASIKTANNLRDVARSLTMRELSQLSLPEIDEKVEAVAQLVPAGNIPGVILNGLARLQDRYPPTQIVKRDVNLLFKGVEKAFNNAVFGAFFATPAAVIWGYQRLLELAGKDMEKAFPNGVWQFYVEYALREDTARHTNETHGFDTLLTHHQIQLSPIDRLTAWVMATIHILHEYPALLANEWRERVYLRELQAVAQGTDLAGEVHKLSGAWNKKRPFSRTPDSPHTYAVYRKKLFDQFLAPFLQQLPENKRVQWAQHVQACKPEQQIYQQQMSILAYLQSHPYGENRISLPLAKLKIGIIHRGNYYLIPVCQAGTEQPAPVEEVRQQIATILQQPIGQSTVKLMRIANIERGALHEFRTKASPELQAAFAQLQHAPILINADMRPRQAVLSDIRQAERGIGDHPLTIFQTGETAVFDQSHIFFDGAWGAGLAEIITRDATAWAFYLHSQTPVTPHSPPITPLRFPIASKEERILERLPLVRPEISAETDMVQLRAILTVRRLFKQRNDLIRLTVNDLLILYRIIHAFSYQPSPNLENALHQLQGKRQSKPIADQILAELTNSKQRNPAILIPIDATARDPKDRIYPMVFEAPLRDMNLITLHQETLAALNAYETAQGNRDTLYAVFDTKQRNYLATLAAFGAILYRAKEIAIEHDSASISTLKLLAHMPPAIQNLLDQIPSRFDALNDLIKGREVFSNTGAVVPSSSLTRFNTAKDDNESKFLAWGVLTDSKGVMRVSLRDFRPFIAPLIELGQRHIAQQITQDYLYSYAEGLNQFVHELRQIVSLSRETQIYRPND